MVSNPPHLVYFADPMCSWCWGFAPVIDKIAQTYPDLAVRLVLGGLRPFTQTPMDDAQKATIRDHWRHVEEASGQPFDYTFFERDGFVYDTEPAARAVVAARRIDPARTFALKMRIARAFYAENRDVTQEPILIDLAGEVGLETNAFAFALTDDATREETLADFAVSQSSGVTGFPTLVAGPDPDHHDRYVAITIGYRPPEFVLPRVSGFLQGHKART
ncbi:DsbA family protein [Jiella marina]|uniref:DsbA family protein n=1 Tax=Jiella sp. LLJ827 TaxID=2917712 RepID=UPI002100B566|nr:DsbA family protein [Jiella sp. LLJ827]MCQ0987483.1 DsbA family protein [Jiella sp. LLJ827]